LSSYVIDTSVAVKWFIPEKDSDLARNVLEVATILFAPDLLLIEFDNVFCRRVRLGEMALSQGQGIRTAFRTLPFEFVPSPGLAEHAFSLAIEIGHTVQDCLYLALAFQRDAVLLTADVVLQRKITNAGFGDRARLLSQGV